jgi:hypothetical protein
MRSVAVFDCKKALHNLGICSIVRYSSVHRSPHLAPRKKKAAPVITRAAFNSKY